MKFLKSIINKSKSYQNLLSATKENLLPLAVTGLSEIHKAHIIYSLCSDTNKKAILIASDEAEAQRFANDISSMGLRTSIYPIRDFNFGNIESLSREYEHQRLSTLLKVLNGECDIIISCIDAALQNTISPKSLNEKNIIIKIGQEVKLSKILSVLTSLGYEKYDQVDGVGQFSLRGGILDLFPTDSTYPIRIEFFGDEIDTMSFFDIESQRRTEQVDKIVLAPSKEIFINDTNDLINKIQKIVSKLNSDVSNRAKEILLSEIEQLENGLIPSSIDKFIPLLENSQSTLFDYIGENDLVFISENNAVKDRLKYTNIRWKEDLENYLKNGTLCKGLNKYSENYDYIIEKFNKNIIYLDNFMTSSYDTTPNKQINFSCKKLNIWNGSLSIICDDLSPIISKQNYDCVILAGTKRSASTLSEDLRSKGFNTAIIEGNQELKPNTVNIVAGCLSSGFEYPDINFTLFSHGITSIQNKKKRRPKNSKEIYNLSELSVGDYVVHSAHGIGIFGGIHKMTMQGIIKDYIKLSYAKGDCLYVPVTQLDMISKYIGPKENSSVKLNRLGGSEWKKTKSRVKGAVKDIAKELIKIYSDRMNSKGFAFSEDSEWQRDFEAHFEHEETPDQLVCIEEIKKDMQSTFPMDRLLCGDVGFGKTEVALRAAFKCVADSKQCAILVPTTILALQHYQNICKRFEDFPVKIELLSRFRTPKEQSNIIKSLERGEIDLIVGTHRLVQNDIKFRDLGLVIIDEEQRFGVAQKEKFKQTYNNIDVLTLSATPIPRTLNMAMSGIRDMSTLEEAPQDRQPVQTYVLEYDPVIIAESIKRELRRGGQVYFLHNNVDSIQRVAASIQMQVPQATVDFAHGKMSEQELSDVWRRMIEQKINVLVCTTIIETGIDLPNVNTLIIDNADCMGLSQLHQLRGRVGRSSRRAYAYLTFKKNKVLSDISQKRLSAIREFTEFGSGFKIAMRDLELRGAGNILGAQQHGHMEDVGYELYLKLLEEAVNEEKGQKTSSYELECLIDISIQAHIPENYIQNLNQRLDIYRRISDIRTKDDAIDVTDELIDRFGDPPEAVNGLIEVALIRNTAASMGIYEIRQNKNSINLYQRKIDMQQAANIIKKSKYKVLVNAASKPYISIQFDENSNPIKILKDVFNSLT